jgi:hypothetical protein
MDDEAADVLRAVERLHSCRAVYKQSEAVHEAFKGEPAWTGSVLVFEVDHPEAATCFAWSSPIDGSERRRYYAILRKPPIETAEDAVRAAIVADHHAGR